MSTTIEILGLDFDRGLAVRAARNHLITVKILHAQPVLSEVYLDVAAHSFASLLGDSEELELAYELIEEALKTDA